MSSGSVSSNRFNHRAPDPEEELVYKFVAIRAVHHLLGNSSHSRVYLCDVEGFEEQVAVKVRIDRPQPKDRDHDRRFFAEHQHPHLVSVFDVLEGPRKCLVMEHCSGGSLSRLLYESAALPVKLHQIPFWQRVQGVAEVVSAIAYLHSKGVLHRDVKSSNCMLAEPLIGGQDPFHVRLPPLKLGDLGLAKRVDPDGSMRETGVGSVRYMAPEVLEQDIHSFPSDVFSCIVLLHEIISGCKPYGALKLHYGKIVVHVLAGFRPPLSELPQGECPARTELLEILGAGWSKDPEERPTAEELQRRLEELAVLSQHEGGPDGRSGPFGFRGDNLQRVVFSVPEEKIPSIGRRVTSPLLEQTSQVSRGLGSCLRGLCGLGGGKSIPSSAPVAAGSD